MSSFRVQLHGNGADVNESGADGLQPGSRMTKHLVLPPLTTAESLETTARIYTDAGEKKVNELTRFCRGHRSLEVTVPVTHDGLHFHKSGL